MIIESIAFCHYSSVFGVLLGLFQYLPTILYFGSWFWSLYKRDTFFVGLAWTMNITWLLALLFKFAIGPLLFSATGNLPNNCDSFVPSVTGILMNTIFGGEITNGTLARRVAFPHVDVMQAGIYNGYVLTFLMAWHHAVDRFSWMSLIGVVSISLVPWAFISSGVSTSLTIGTSFVTGLAIGTCSIFIVYKIVQRFYKKDSKWSQFWCGDLTPPTGLL